MPEEEHLDAFIGRLTVEYLSNYNRREPFLVFVGFGGPHPPFDPPPSWAEKYDPKEIEKLDLAKPVTKPGPWVPSLAAEHQRKLQNDSLKITPEINARMRALYYAKISHIDWWVGKILDTLEERGMLDNTAIVFCSDHGEMLGDKGRLGKGVFYEESVHIPLIIRPVEADSRGTVCDKLVSLIDIYPTILDLAGCKSVWRGFGKSLLPLINEPEAPHHDAVFSEIESFSIRRTMIINERFKMVIDNAGTVLKLYDLKEDPEENVNLVGKTDTEKIVSKLKHRTLTWILETQTRQTIRSCTDICRHSTRL